MPPMRNRFYFALKPLLPLRVRWALRRWHTQRALRIAPELWPIDASAGVTPRDWPGWPEGKQFAFVLSHDVESGVGVNQALALAKVEENLGFRSSFNFVPEGSYETPDALRAELARRGFEVGIHDLHHDGRLYASRQAFRRSAQQINRYIREWGVAGFRSAFMLHKLDWLHDLEISYDASTFDTDPIEPQPDAATTIFPFWVPKPEASSAGGGSPPTPSLNPKSQGYVELPYTLPQDSTLYLFLEEKTIDIWKRKLDWLASRGGMVFLNLHPDYVGFPDQPSSPGTYPLHLYRQLLDYVREKYEGCYWQALPRDVARYVRESYPSGGPRRPRHTCMLSYSFFERDNRVARYAKALSARGDIVDVLSLNEDSAPSPEIAQEPPVHVYHLRKRQRDERHIVDFILRILSFCWSAHRKLSRLQKLRNYDVIHVHNVPDFIIFAATLPRLKGAKLILDLHDLLPEFYQSKFHSKPDSPIIQALRFCERLCCRFANHVIVSNHIWREKVAARSADPNRCSAFVNHVDEELFLPRTSELRSPPLIAVFPGGFYQHQGLHIAVRAFALLARESVPVELHIVGDGPERNNLVELTRELGAEQVVRFFPPVPLKSVPDLLSRADLGVVPKLADGFGNEAYSTKIMEFMAAGLPVVASETKIDRHYFGDGYVHFFKSGNPEDMARAIKEVIQDPTLHERLVRRGLEYVHRENWSRKSQEYLAIVDGLIDEKSRQEDTLAVPS